MWSLFLTILIWHQPGKVEVAAKQEIVGIATSADCEKAASDFRSQQDEHTKVMTVCIRKG